MNAAEIEEADAERVEWYSEDNIIYQNKDKKVNTFSFLQFGRWLLLDNQFMNRLFPEIK